VFYFTKDINGVSKDLQLNNKETKIFALDIIIATGSNIQRRYKKNQSPTR